MHANRKENTHQEEGRIGAAGRLRGSVLSAFSYRDYSILWSGALASNVGTWMQNAALAYYIFQRYQSNGWVGLTNFFYNLPVVLFFLLAGSVADFFDKRRLLIVTQAGMAIGALALAVLVTTGTANLATMNVALFFAGLFLVINFPAWQTILPEMVEPADLLNAVALNSAQWNAARFVGPLIAGALLAVWTADIIFYINAASFLAVIFALVLIRTRRATVPWPRQRIDVAHMTAGVRFAWHSGWARAVLFSLGIFTFFGLPYVNFTPAFAINVLHRGALLNGILLGASGFGAVVGALVVSYLARFLYENTLIRLCSLGIGVSLLLFCISTNMVLSVFLMFCTGAFFLMTASAINSVLQLRVGAEIRARIMSLYVFMLIGTFPVGGVLIGFLGDRIGIRLSLGGGATVCIITSILLIVHPRWLAEAVVPAHIKKTIPPPKLLSTRGSRTRRSRRDAADADAHAAPSSEEEKG